MRMTRGSFPTAIAVETYEGMSGVGAKVYADAPHSEQAALEFAFRKITNKAGAEVTISATALMPYDATIVVDDRVTIGGQNYEVVQVSPQMMGKHVHHLEVYLASIG